MKKIVFCMILCVIPACLAACGAKGPTVTADGVPWDDNWIMVGLNIGAENPGTDFTLRDVKGAKKMTFTAWSAGEAQPHTNAQGEESNVYDAQLVVLVVEAGTAEAAQANVDEWLSLSGDAYTVTNTAQQVLGGQEFTVLTYDFSSENSAYARGSSAFAVYGGCAISAEFACQDSYEGNPAEILTGFLENCHYAA